MCYRYSRTVVFTDLIDIINKGIGLASSKLWSRSFLTGSTRSIVGSSERASICTTRIVRRPLVAIRERQWKVGNRHFCMSSPKFREAYIHRVTTLLYAGQIELALEASIQIQYQGFIFLCLLRKGVSRSIDCKCSERWQDVDETLYIIVNNPRV